MAGKHQHTAEIEALIVGYIHQGAYPYVAAEAAGIPRKVFERWMRRGANTGDQPYRDFWVRVQRVAAAVRIRQECYAFKNDPKLWLRYGPGRDAPARPGWSNPLKRRPRKKKAAALDRAVRQHPIWVWVLEALTPFPDAREAVIGVLHRAEAAMKRTPGKAPGTK